MKKISLLIILLVSLNNLLHAASPSYHGDSVMGLPSGGITYSSGSMVISSQTKSVGNQYTSTQVEEYQTGVCPTGLTVNGFSTYQLAKRIVTATYLGNQLVSSTIGSWIDLDIDCRGLQLQTIGCPDGFTGLITQERTVSTASTGNGTYQFSEWNTILNACIPLPTAKPTYLRITPHLLGWVPEDDLYLEIINFIETPVNQYLMWQSPQIGTLIKLNGMKCVVDASNNYGENCVFQ